MKPSHAFFVAIIAFLFIKSAQAEQNQYTVTKFNLSVEMQSKNQVKVKLDSDVPNGIPLSLRAYRIYDGVDETTKKVSVYSTNYFDVDVYTEDLKRGQVYELDNQEWKQNFESKQHQTSVLGIKFLPKTIADQVTFSVILPINAAPDILGNNNTKLTGPVVQREFSAKLLSTEKQIIFPLNEKPQKFASLNPENLDIGHTYRTLQEQTPLMSHYNPNNASKALEEMKILPSDTSFTILKRITHGNETWYQVRVELSLIKLKG